jgi:hypothetical protein
VLVGVLGGRQDLHELAAAIQQLLQLGPGQS